MTSHVPTHDRSPTWLRSSPRPHVGPPHEVGVLERPLLLPRRYTTLSPVPVTSILNKRLISSTWEI